MTMERYRCNRMWSVEQHHFHARCRCLLIFVNLQLPCNQRNCMHGSFFRLKPTHKHAKSKLANLCWSIERLNRTNTSHSFVLTHCAIYQFSLVVVVNAPSFDVIFMFNNHARIHTVHSQNPPSISFCHTFRYRCIYG